MSLCSYVGLQTEANAQHRQKLKALLKMQELREIYLDGVEKLAQEYNIKIYQNDLNEVYYKMWRTMSTEELAVKLLSEDLHEREMAQIVMEFRNGQEK